MQRELKQELISLWIVFLQEIGMPKFIIRRAMGITPLAMHILTERAKMTRALWLKVMWRDNWVCYICHEARRPNDPFEAEHKIPLFRFGYTTLENLGCAHKSCNRKKGTKLIEQQILYPFLKQTKAIFVFLFLAGLLLLWIVFQMKLRLG